MNGPQSRYCEFSFVEISDGLYRGWGFLNKQEGCEVGGIHDGEDHGVQPHEQNEDPDRVHARFNSLRFTEVLTKGVSPG